jgi:Mn2+/Fe2+ NRAMP family transporter
MTLQGGNMNKKFSFPAPDKLFAEQFSVRKLLKCMAFFGPAAIVASVSVGGGETILAVRTGAWSGYALIWLVLLACLTKNLFLEYGIGRYTVITGEFLGDAWARMPGPRGWFLWFILIIGWMIAPFFVSAIAGACGGLMKTIFGFGDPRVWGTLFAVGAIGLGIGGSFTRLEQQQILICGVLVLGTLIGGLISSPSLLEFLKGTFSFGYVPPYPDWVQVDPNFVGRSKPLELATLFGYIGGGMSLYVVYAHWTAIHGWGMNSSPHIKEIRDFARNQGPIYLSQEKEEVRKANIHLTKIRWDIALGAFVLFFVTCAFLIAGAAVLHPRHLLPGGYILLSHQKAIWEQLSPVMVPVYYVTILAALWGTLYAIPELYARINYEFLGALFPAVRRVAYQKVFLYVGVYIGVVSAFIIWTGMKPVTMMDIAAMISTNIGIMLVCYGTLWLNASLPREYRMGKTFLVGVIITAAILTVVSAVSVTQMWAKYIGN